jgi:hypothetical protein
VFTIWGIVTAALLLTVIGLRLLLWTRARVHPGSTVVDVTRTKPDQDDDA